MPRRYYLLARFFGLATEHVQASVLDLGYKAAAFFEREGQEDLAVRFAELAQSVETLKGEDDYTAACDVLQTEILKLVDEHMASKAPTEPLA